MHLLIDGYDGDPRKLASEAAVRQFLETLPEVIGMTPITDPAIVRYQAVNSEDGGLSGFRIVAESHLSVHTYPETASLWADIFSCNRFDADKVIATVGEVFGLLHAQTLHVPRGIAETRLDNHKWRGYFRRPVFEER